MPLEHLTTAYIQHKPAFEATGPHGVILPLLSDGFDLYPYNTRNHL